jgi:hypothetical protein
VLKVEVEAEAGVRVESEVGVEAGVDKIYHRGK